MKNKVHLLENNMLEDMGLLDETIQFFLRPVLLMKEPCMSLCLKIQVNERLYLETFYTGEKSTDMNLSVLNIKKHTSDSTYGSCYSLETCMNLTDEIVGFPFVISAPDELGRIRTVEISWCIQDEKEEEIILIDRYELTSDHHPLELGNRYILDAVADFQKRISRQKTAQNVENNESAGELEAFSEIWDNNFDVGCITTGRYYRANYFVDFEKHNEQVRLHFRKDHGIDHT